MKKLRCTIWRDESSESRAIESAIRNQGYEVRTITQSKRGITASTETCYTLGYYNVLASFGII